MSAQLVLLHSRQALGPGTRAALREHGGQEAVILTERKGPLFRDNVAHAAIKVVEAAKRDWLSVIRAEGGTPQIVTNDEFCLMECRALRHAFGLDDPFPRDLTNYRDKAAMRRALLAHSVCH